MAFTCLTSTLEYTGIPVLLPKTILRTQCVHFLEKIISKPNIDLTRVELWFCRTNLQWYIFSDT